MVTIWDLETEQMINIFELNTAGGYIAFMPDGKHFVVSCDTGNIEIWNIQTGQFVRKLGSHPSIVTGLIVTCNGTNM